MSKHYEKDQVFIHVNGLVDFENSASSGDIIYDVSGAPGHDIDILINYRFVDKKK